MSVFQPKVQENAKVSTFAVSPKSSAVKKNASETRFHDWNNFLAVLLINLGVDIVIRRAAKLNTTKTRPNFPVDLLINNGQVVFNRDTLNQFMGPSKDAHNALAFNAMIDVLQNKDPSQVVVNNYGKMNRGTQRETLRYKVSLVVRGVHITDNTIERYGRKALEMLKEAFGDIPKNQSVRFSGGMEHMTLVP